MVVAEVQPPRMRSPMAVHPSIGIEQDVAEPAKGYEGLPHLLPVDIELAGASGDDVVPVEGIASPADLADLGIGGSQFHEVPVHPRHRGSRQSSFQHSQAPLYVCM